MDENVAPSLQSRTVSLLDDLETINGYFRDHAWTDGLPIIPPTEARIARMLGGTQQDPAKVIGRVPIRYGQASVEVIAVNAVMAGCLPEYMPLLIAAVDALCQPELNVHSLQATTSTAAVGAVVNGPVVHDLFINYQHNALGCGHWSNATIGRALRLILTTVGGGIPGLVDMSTHGQPGKHTLCFAENEAASPWEPLHVSRGFNLEDSTVTLFGFGGTIEIVDAASDTAEGLLTTIVRSMTIAGTYGDGDLLGGGEPLLVLCPEHAQLIARDGYDRADIQKYIFENARLPLRVLSAKVADYIRDYRRKVNMDDVEADLRVAQNPDDIMVVVAGGDGAKSTFIPTWTGGTQAVSRRISL